MLQFIPTQEHSLNATDIKANTDKIQSIFL